MILIKNAGSGKELECETAYTFFDKVRGLMFRKKIAPILFDFNYEGTHGIHSFFVFSPFYAIYLSASKEVIDKFRVVPNEAYRCNASPARYLLEIDEGRAAWFNKGDKVVFE
ncbi:DUF192 domain-containing protein [Candidatus Micrarchaeota archaeon]|nr:DUF192 domain-containing protein [Candidatus Micrarchaeota archaeon]